MAPVAVHASLALTVAGARGDTRRQVLQVCLPLAGRVFAASATGNAAVAPVAVHASLALTVAGARGDTRRQVLQVLGVVAHPPAAAAAVHGAGGSRDSGARCVGRRGASGAARWRLRIPAAGLGARGAAAAAPSAPPQS